MSVFVYDPAVYENAKNHTDSLLRSDGRPMTPFGAADMLASLSMQEYLNKMSMENARQVYALQEQADQAAMRFSADEAQKLRDWQADQSNTAYQRAVVDMRKAGINPALAISNGGASTPSGAAASGVSSARQIPQLNLENYVYQFKNLVRSLNTSERNAETAAEAERYSATVRAAASVFNTLVSNDKSIIPTYRNLW